MPRLLVPAAIVWSLAIAGGCGGAVPERGARHLLLVTLDTTRADRLGCYGHSRAATPTIDALASRGVRFERAYAQVPITLPSHVSILTGLVPPHTGIHVNGQTRLAPGVRTLAEILAGHGFYTAAAVGGFPLVSRFPVAKGFEQFDDRMVNPDSPQGLERDAGEVVRAALRLLDRRGDRRVFLWIHFFDPHDPYEPAPPFGERFAGDPYQGEIARVDAALGELLDALASRIPREQLLICVVGDHGEALGEHGEPTHGFFIYEPTVRVPLVLAGPGVPSGVTLPGPVRTVDLVPTLLSGLGLPVPGGLDGRVLPLRPGGGGDAPPVYLETELPQVDYGWSPLRGIVDGSMKLIDAPRPEIYDLVRDPGESRDRASESSDEYVRLRGRLRELAAAPAVANEHDVVPDPRLMSLGYLAGASAEGREAMGLADPKDRLQTYVRFQEASRALERGEPETALPILDELLGEEDSPGVRFKRAVAFRLKHRLDLAARELDRVAAVAPGFPGLALERLYLALAGGDFEAALKYADAQLAVTPEHPEATMLRGAAREKLGDLEGAERDYRRALDLNPAYGAASLRLAALLVRGGRFGKARETLRAHLAYHPSDPLAQGLLGALPER